MIIIDQAGIIRPLQSPFGMWVGGQFARIDWMTGNWMTMIGIMLIPPMALCLGMDLKVAGTILAGSIYFSDLFDGMIARYHQSFLTHELTYEAEMAMSFLEKLGHKGTSRLGKLLDPIRDKATFMILMTKFGYGYIHPVLFWGCVIMAVLLTIGRPIQKALGRGDGAANNLGKYKVHAQWVSMLNIMWLPAWPIKIIVCHSLIGVALMLAIGSFTKHMLAPRLA